MNPGDVEGFFEGEGGARFTNGTGAHVEDGDAAWKIPLLTGPDLAKPLPELEYLVREIGLVDGAGAPHLLAGYGYSGKTVAAQSLALSLASGTRAWGVHTCAKVRRVLHIDFEQGQRLTQRRYQRLAFAAGLDLAELGDDLALAVMPGIKLAPQWRAAWADVMGGRDLMVVDSLRAASTGQDENSSEIRGGLDMLGSLSEETKCRALVIHHARKVSADDPGGRYAIRGSSAIFDGCDAIYLFGAAKGEPVKVEHLKARTDGETKDDFALVISDDPEEGGDPKAGLKVQVHGAELIAERRATEEQRARKVRAQVDSARVKDALSRSPGLGTKDLRAVTGFGGDRLSAAILALGAGVEVREERNGTARATCRHYLK